MPAAELVAAVPGRGICDVPGVNLSGPCTLQRAFDGAKDAVGSIATGALRDIGEAVVGLAREVLGAVVEFVSAPVNPDLSQGWFSTSFDRMVSVSGLFAAVFFLCALISSTMCRSFGGLARTVGFTVGAFVASGVALFLTQGFIALVDVATAQVAASSSHDMVETFVALLRPLDLMLTGDGGRVLLAALLAFFVGLAALAMYVELFIRNVMIHVVVFFVPLMLVGGIWEPTRRWARRGIEFLAVLIFSKFVMYAVIALGWSAVASFNDMTLSAAWASVLTGLVLIVVAAFLPVLLFRMLPFMESHVRSAFSGRDAGRIAGAPLSPVTSSMRTLEVNLGRASRVAAALSGGGGVVAAGSAAAAGGGSRYAAPTAAPRPALPAAGTPAIGSGPAGNPSPTTPPRPTTPPPPDRGDESR